METELIALLAVGQPLAEKPPPVKKPMSAMSERELSDKFLEFERGGEPLPDSVRRVSALSLCSASRRVLPHCGADRTKPRACLAAPRVCAAQGI